MILLNFCFKLHGHNFWHHFCPRLHHCHPSILAGTTTILLPNKLSQGFGFQFLPLYLDEYTKSSSSDFKGGWKGEMFNQTCRAQRTTQERKTSPIISIFCQLCLSRPTNWTYCNYLGWFSRLLLRKIFCSFSVMVSISMCWTFPRFSFDLWKPTGWVAPSKYSQTFETNKTQEWTS